MAKLGKTVAKKATGNTGPKKKGARAGAVRKVRKYTATLSKDRMTDKKAANKALKKAANMTWNAEKNANYKKALDYVNQYANRPDFSYDLNSDNLYKQYKNQYINNAQSAMRDTIAQQNAANGGFGSSYAGVAAQQQYQRNLDNLNNVVPQLYEAAYNKYQDKGQALMNSANAYQGMYGLDKDAFDTNLANAQWNQGVLENRRLTSANAYGDMLQYLANMDYQKGRDAVADKQWNKEFNAAKSAASSVVSSSGGGGGGGGGRIPTGDPKDKKDPGGDPGKPGELVMTNMTTLLGNTNVPVYTDGKRFYVKNGASITPLDSGKTQDVASKYNAAVMSIAKEAKGGMYGAVPFSKLTGKAAKKAVTEFAIKRAQELGVGIGDSQIEKIFGYVYGKKKVKVPKKVKKAAKKTKKKNK